MDKIITNWRHTGLEDHAKPRLKLYRYGDVGIQDIESRDIVQFSSVPLLCLTLCSPMNWSMKGLPLHHQLPEFTQTYVH